MTPEEQFDMAMLEFLKPQLEKARQEGIAQGSREKAEEILIDLEETTFRLTGKRLNSIEWVSFKNRHLGKVEE